MSTKSKAAAAEEKKPITLSSEHVPLSYRIKKDLQRNGMIYAMLIPVLVYYAIFKFGPMFGLYISFIDYKPARGIFGSKFVGLKWFKSFFSDYYFGRLLINTVRIAVADLLTFPLPVILALLINELKNKKFSKTAQTLLYVPHFISTVVICGIVITLTSSTGAITEVLHNFFGIKEQALLNNPSNFLPIYILTELWQTLGWNSIIYLAALAGIDPQLHESAQIDGASRLQRVWHINLPGIRQTIILLFILDCGKIMSVGFEKAYLLQNALNLPVSEIISTYVYKTGVQGAKFSYTTAIGLFNSLVNVMMLLIVNRISRALSDILDEADPIESSYIFEVASAGAERPLKRPGDFAQFMGAPVLLKTYKPVDGRKEFSGDLAGYDDGAVTLRIGEEERRFEKDVVALVRLRCDF